MISRLLGILTNKTPVELGDLTHINEISLSSNTENFGLDDNITDKLNKQRLENPKNIIIGHLNINSLRNKLDFTKDIFGNNIDILLLSETKLDSSYPASQFYIDGFRTFRKDRDQNGGGLVM